MALPYDHLPAVHEHQELQEAHNLLGAGLGAELGLAVRAVAPDLTAVRMSAMPRNGSRNQVFGFTAAHMHALPALEAWFDEAGCAVHLRLGADLVNDGEADALVERGYTVSEVEAWMVADLAHLRIEASDHRIEPVADEAGNEAFARAICAGWEVHAPAVQRVVRGAMAPWPQPGTWHRFVAWVDDEPAAEALLVVRGACAYLAEAATDPQYRRRGLQRALIARRAEAARELGCTTLFGMVAWGDASWSNMRATGLREGHMTLRYHRLPR